jgi:two-component system sensor histidine kinase KdpD
MARSRTVVDSPEDVLVAVSGGAASEELMRRGVRLARRRGGLCLVVTVVKDSIDDARVDRFRRLAEQLGCSFAVLAGQDPATTIIQAARDAGSDHVVVGEITRSEWLDRLRPTLVDKIIDGLPDADIHVIARVVK